MKKQFARNSSKHDPITSETLLCEINKRIVDTFVRIEKHDHHERAVDQELTWLTMELEKNWKILSPVHIATLLNNLSNLEISDQNIAINVINLGLKRCT